MAFFGAPAGDGKEGCGRCGLMSTWKVTRLMCSDISGVHHSSSAFQVVSLGFSILLRSQLYLGGSPFFFCVPSYISGVHHSSSVFPAISLGFIILLLCSQLYLWGSPFFCVPSYISGVHHSYSAFPAISLGFTILLLCSQLYLWGSPFLLGRRVV